MKKFQRSKETASMMRRVRAENEVAQNGIEIKEMPTAKLPEHPPKFKEPGHEKYSVDMLGVTLVRIPENTRVELSTEYLSTCTAVAMAVREPFSGETFGMLAHFPFYFGDEFDSELARYDRVTDERAEKKVAIIIPYNEDPITCPEVQKIKLALQAAMVPEGNIIVLKHSPTGGFDPPEQEGKVDLIFEKDGRVTVRHLAPNSKVTTTELFPDKQKL